MTSSEYQKVSVYLSNIKNGTRDSFADLFSMYEKKVYFLCFKLLKSKSEAQKITIEIFDYVYLQISTFKNAASFDKWLYTTAAVKCRKLLLEKHPELFGDYIDSDSVEGLVIDELMQDDIREMEHYPDGIEVDVGIMQTMDQIMSNLPLKLRVAVLQYYFSGLDIEDIALSEQISVTALKNRLYKARIRLRTEEHKFSELGYAVEGSVLFIADVLSTMADSIVVPPDIASGVTASTGIICTGMGRAYDSISDTDATTFVDVPPKPKSNYVTTSYAAPGVPAKKKQEVSPAVKVLMAIVAILIIIGGTVAVVLAVKGGSFGGLGSVETAENTQENTTLNITTKEHTTNYHTTETTTETTTVTTTETTTVTTTATTTETTTASTTETTTETTTIPPLVDENPQQ